MRATQVVAAAWTGYRRSWRYLVPLALLGYLAVGLLAVFLIFGAGLLGVLAAAILYAVAYVWTQGMLVQAIGERESAKGDLSFGSRFRRLFPRLNALSLAFFLSGFGVFAGLVLLIVPGLVVLTWWSLFVPVIVLEGQGPLRALRRSRELVRGRGWFVFRVILCQWLLAGFGERAIENLAGLLPISGYLAAGIGLLASASVVTPFVALTSLTLYYELRDGPRGKLPPLLVSEQGSGRAVTAAVTLAIGAAIIGPLLLSPPPQDAELTPPVQVSGPPPSDHPVDRGALTALAGSPAQPFAHARSSFLYLLPLDTRAADELQGIAKRVQETYGICTELLDTWQIDQQAFDPQRHQLDGIVLLGQVRSLRDWAAVDESSVILAVTALDIYASSVPEAQFALELADHPDVVLSTARLEDAHLLDTRLWKLVTGEIGFHLYGLTPSSDPASPLYAGLATPTDLDRTRTDLPGFTGDNLAIARKRAHRACRALRNERPSVIATQA